MRKVNVKDIQKTVEGLCIKANLDLRPDILAVLKRYFRSEQNKRAKDVLRAIIENARIAKKEKIAICQDTGMVSVFIEIGESAKIIGGNLEASITQGVRDAYEKGRFRKSVVKDPLIRRNTEDNTPCVIHVKFRKGNRVRIVVLPKGFGSENKSKLKMFNPTASVKDIKKFIVEAVKEAGPDACPPFIVGIGIGGTSDKAIALAKEATTVAINKKNPKEHLAKLENEVMKDVNKLKIGPMGLGGRATVLGINILSYPTHIAGMPVAVNISCHATRSASKII